MNPTKKLLFTFDYELFLGERSGSVQKCMIEPTDKLISLFDKFRIKHAIFFVDTTYLIRLKAESVTNDLARMDYATIVAQLQKLIQKEHYIFPHIHPHWLDARYAAESNQWSLPNLSLYRFHSLTIEQREKVFDASIALLKEIIEPLHPNYQLDGYRAGGWCIQPFTDFYPHFKKHAIHYDFSVLPGIKNLSSAQFYDFENAPKQHIYHFEEEVTKLDPNGAFTQMAISVAAIPSHIQFANKFLLKLLWKTGNRSLGDGSGVVASKLKNEPPVISTNLEMISIELLTQIKLSIYLKFLGQHDFMHFISHPKMLSPHNLTSFEIFLKKVVKQYKIETDFRKMLDEV